MGRNFIWGTQRSILGTMLFNIFLCDLFFTMNNVNFARYADDNTPFFVGNDLDEVIFKLQSALKPFSNGLLKTK